MLIIVSFYYLIIFLCVHQCEWLFYITSLKYFQNCCWCYIECYIHILNWFKNLIIFVLVKILCSTSIIAPSNSSVIFRCLNRYDVPLDQLVEINWEDARARAGYPKKLHILLQINQAPKKNPRKKYLCNAEVAHQSYRPSWMLQRNLIKFTLKWPLLLSQLIVVLYLDNQFQFFKVFFWENNHQKLFKKGEKPC